MKTLKQYFVLLISAGFLSCAFATDWNDRAFVAYTYFDRASLYSITVQTIGNMTYYRDNRGACVTAMKIGDMISYSNTEGSLGTVQFVGGNIIITDSHGNSTTIMKVGDQVLVSGSNGYALTLQKTGNQIHVADNEGNSALAQKIGNQIHVSDNTGYSLVHQKIGDQTLVNDNEGNSLMVQKMGKQVLVSDGSIDVSTAEDACNTKTIEKKDPEPGVINAKFSSYVNKKGEVVYRSALQEIDREKGVLSLDCGFKMRFSNSEKFKNWKSGDKILAVEVAEKGAAVGYKVKNQTRNVVVTCRPWK